MAHGSASLAGLGPLESELLLLKRLFRLFVFIIHFFILFSLDSGWWLKALVEKNGTTPF